MADPLVLDLSPDADDPTLLARVAAYYHDCLTRAAEAQTYLHRRGLTRAGLAEHFRLGFADRSLGVAIPERAVRAGAAIRDRLTEVGVLLPTGHQRFRGSVVVPTFDPAAAGVVALYGRKVGHGLRPSADIHTHLPDGPRGVWNPAALSGGGPLIVVPSVWDALTFWTHGHEAVTATFSADAIPADLLAALTGAVGRVVYTTTNPLTSKLTEAGLEVRRLRLPAGVDVNEYARGVTDPADALTALVRAAEPASPRRTVPVATNERSNPPASAPELSSFIRTPGATVEPIPPAPADLSSFVRTIPDGEPQITDDEIVVVYGDRRYRVRGLEADPPGEMKVNVLVKAPAGMHVDTLDLYVAKARRAFTEQAAAELGVEEGVVKRDIGRLLLALEQVRDARRQASRPEGPADAGPPPMPDAERQAAMALLTAPDLLDRVAADFGVVGERSTKLLAYLAAVSRKLDTPLAVVVQSVSAAGKSTLMDAALALCPPEDVVRYTALTGQSLYYMGEESLKNKVLALAEEEGASKAAYALKLLQSEGELRIASTAKDEGGRLTTQEYRVDGPVGLFTTTTSIHVDEELLNRCLVLTVDEGPQATAAIHAAQRQAQTLDGLRGRVRRQEVRTLHRNAQRLLRPLPVVNPFAAKLAFPTGSTRLRRDHQKYLVLIQAITLLHQHQRNIRVADIDGRAVEYVEVAAEDITAANELTKEVLARTLTDLPPQTARLLDKIVSNVTEQCEAKGLDRPEARFSFKDVRSWTAWGDTQLKLHIRRLLDGEYLIAHRDRHTRRRAFELAVAPADQPQAAVLADPA